MLVAPKQAIFTHGGRYLDGSWLNEPKSVMLRDAGTVEPSEARFERGGGFAMKVRV